MSSPRVSIVVPIRANEPHLRECLDSLEAQTLTDIEVVLVDRGAADTLPDVPGDRFRVTSAEGASVGAARDAGTAAATGEFLMFVDAGTVLAEDACERLVGTLDATGSDFAAGNVHVLTDARPRQSPRHGTALGRTRKRTHISRDQDLFADSSVAGKVFRRAFWDRHGLGFGDGGGHGDLAITLPAHFHASSVDVLHDPVCFERPETAKPPFDDAAATEAFAAATKARAFLTARGRGGRKHLHHYDEVALGDLLKSFLDAMPDADEPLRRRIVELAAGFVGETGLSALDPLPALTRLKWYLAHRGFATELVKLVRFERGKTNVEIVRRRGRRYARYPYFSHEKMAIPRSVYRAGPELNLRTKVHSLSWRDGKLQIAGEAHIHSFSERRRWLSLKLFVLRRGGSRRTVVVPALSRRRPGAAKGNDPYEWAGFAITIDPKRLRTKGAWRDGNWDIVGGVVNTGVFRKARLRGGSTGSAAHPPYHYVDDDVRVIPELAGGRLRLRIETVRAKAVGCRFDGAELVIEGRLSGKSAKPSALRLSAGRDVEPVDLPLTVTGSGDGATAFEARVGSAELPADGPVNGWNVAVVAGKETPRLVMAEGLDDARSLDGDSELVAGRTWDGYLRLSAQPVRPVTSTVEWRPDGTLVLSGEHSALDSRPADVVLRLRGRSQEHHFPVTVDGTRFQAEINVAAVTSMAGTLPLRAGTWDVLFRRDVDGAARAVELGRAAAERFPAQVEVAGRRYTLDHHRYDQLLITVGSNVQPDEAHGQRKLWAAARDRAAREGLKDAVMYISYNGKQFSDSPRAIHTELMSRGSTLEQLWEVNDAQTEVPGTVRAIRRRGAEWYDALASSRYIVSNVRMPEFFKRRPDQILIQAWHGTPLKKVGRDVKEVHFSYAPGMATVKKKETKSEPKLAEWSHLISPNRFSTEILGRAFKGSYEEILEVGFPRNDILYSPDADKIVAEVRARIGIPDGKRVILYGPTWRDDQYYGRGRYKFDLQLDLDEAKRRLGDDHVLLIRPHSNVVDAVPGAGDGFVYDVAAYPDVNDLFLIADVLITDYSSLMFDYANTGRPMLFFTYDLEHYRDTLRGFYIDFEKESPGPLLRTSEEVIDALVNIDQVAKDYQEAYDRFAERFCDLDDGRAAARVIEQVFEKN
ncbi:bifunctional glycosyltransferase family 2 protein/CDP-glycerol:glycerophosphate glycerophosphotransferase [Actinomadura sp. HBU206391]|uniref:bifunctional glycosyltransferase/CDP-glycerol:glycerophosphate glycerophosphotransferase n=1 Tax=Actinomadura sp. HBU206391 TaxID=2731692 RepID=UPI00164F654C|nr:bifunctional glycosyltransferase family 2 protein/CDP-glycerol:glycerophosphate glycerophosphotransferase [Actinomadura sp. HBU206391]MBC6458762.1 bifunctional glycosyltransferase family 2 protein/CDP-glycerol:glycerophosphate glycerophosphotransferase [Actinomadura sp. HBU206391]